MEEKIITLAGLWQFVLMLLGAVLVAALWYVMVLVLFVCF